jgi:hypothetical protein
VADDAERKRGWWHTMPGALTAVAGLITAIATLLVALDQLGTWGDDGAANAPPSAASDSPAASDPTTLPAGSDDYGIVFPEGNEATLTYGHYEVVDSRVEPGNPGELALVLTIRMTNNNWHGPLHFTDGTFRLLAGGVARAPSTSLNKLVAFESSLDEDVIFVVRQTEDLALRLVDQYADNVDLPLELVPPS